MDRTFCPFCGASEELEYYCSQCGKMINVPKIKPIKKQKTVLKTKNKNLFSEIMVFIFVFLAVLLIVDIIAKESNIDFSYELVIFTSLFSLLLAPGIYGLLTTGGINN